MSEPSLKCEKNAIFKQNYNPKLFFNLKWPIIAVSDFLQKSYITSTSGPTVNVQSTSESFP